MKRRERRCQRRTTAVAILAAGGALTLWSMAVSADSRTRAASQSRTDKAETNERAVVNINDASAEQLQLLPRVGPSTAKNIIAYRERRRFRRTTQLLRVRGIGPRTFRRLRPHVTISGPTTLTRKIRR